VVGSFVRRKTASGLLLESSWVREPKKRDEPDASRHVLHSKQPTSTTTDESDPWWTVDKGTDDRNHSSHCPRWARPTCAGLESSSGRGWGPFRHIGRQHR